jgi:hypothetical protein
MRLLISTSLFYDIRIMCLHHVPGATNIVADGLSRYFQGASENLLDAGLLNRPMPTYTVRQRWWQGCGRLGLLEEWSQILEQPILQDSTPSLSLVSPWVGASRI